MNKQEVTVKHRAHRVLFDQNSPFRRARAEVPRVAYKRQPKHRNRQD